MVFELELLGVIRLLLLFAFHDRDYIVGALQEKLELLDARGLLLALLLKQLDFRIILTQ